MYLSDWMSTSPYSTGYCIQTNFHLTFKATDRIRLEHAYIQRNNKQVKCVENPAVLLKFARGITEQTISSFSTYGLKPALILCVCVCRTFAPSEFPPTTQQWEHPIDGFQSHCNSATLATTDLQPSQRTSLELVGLPADTAMAMRNHANTRVFGMSLQWVWRQHPPQTGSLQGERPVWDGGTNSSCFFVCVTIRILIWTVVQLN